MKAFGNLALSLALLIPAAELAAALPGDAPARNTQTAKTPQRIPQAPDGGGLAPTTWGFVSHYTGTAYGTGYYPFRVDLTYGGTNSIYGYTFNYPSAGFVNDIRAVYLFDISSLIAQPGPVWSAYMLEARQKPAAGNSSLVVYSGVSMESAGSVRTLEGTGLTQGAGARDIDVYDAEDFENPDPFNTPEAGFAGTAALIGSFNMADNVATPFSVNISNAVAGDTPSNIPVPALGTLATAAIALLLVLGGVLMLRRRSGEAV
jgi:hypothetical protein